MPNDKGERPKRPGCRPRTHPIPDTPENVARILMATKPKPEAEWQYLKNAPPTGPYRQR